MKTMPSAVLERVAERPAALRFATLRPDDLFAIERQPSQQTVLGLPAVMTEELAEQSCAQAVAWCARQHGRIVACFGILEQFAGRQGLGWAVLAEGIGMGHFALTRFIQSQIAGCGLARLELLARGPDLEAAIAAGRIDPEDPQDLLVSAWRAATPEMRWAVLLGLRPAHVLRQYGAAGETFVLFERIRPLTGEAG